MALTKGIKTQLSFKALEKEKKKKAHKTMNRVRVRLSEIKKRERELHLPLQRKNERKATKTEKRLIDEGKKVEEDRESHNLKQ